jgi:transposase
MCKFIGIDVSKDKANVVVTGDIHEQQVEVENNTKGHQTLVKRLSQLGINEGHVCMEATGTYYEGLAEHLHRAGFRVSVVNPARIKDYGRSKGRRNKTDRLDAWLIADYCRTQQPAQWLPPSAEMRELRGMARRRESLMQMRQQEVNRLKSGAYQASMMAHTQQLITYLTQQVTEVERLIGQHIKAHRSLQRLCKLLTSIPGIALKSAWCILAEIQDMAVFASAKQLAAYAGLTPEQVVSGSSVRGQSRLTKFGNRRLRTAFFFPALVAMRSQPFFRAFAQRHLAKGLCKMAVVVLLMHKLIRIVFGVLKSGQPFNLATLTS